VSSVELSQLSIYGYLIGSGALIIVLYSYIIYLYRGEKKGKRDYEKYGNLALDDELDSDILEKNPKIDNSNKE